MTILRRTESPVDTEALSTDSRRLQMLMSKISLERLNHLKEKTEAASYGEVVRRALQVYENVFEDIDFIKSDDKVSEGLNDERIHVIIPAKTFDRIERLQAKDSALSYSEIIRRALTAYEKVCRDKLTEEILSLRTAA